MKDLKKSLKPLEREKRAEAIDTFLLGMQHSMAQAPRDNPRPEYRNQYARGYYVGQQFGPLEVESATGIIFEETSRLKRKYNRKGFWARLFEIDKDTDYTDIMWGPF